MSAFVASIAACGPYLLTFFLTSIAVFDAWGLFSLDARSFIIVLDSI